jgi:hypothetical protein
MPLHDYRCPAHGLFESLEARCAHTDCQQTVAVVFLKPVGFVSDRTRRTDASLRKTAESFGMTDLKSAREGENHADCMPDTVEPVFYQEQPVREPPKNILWGEQGGITAKGAFGGDKALDLSKGGVKLSPLAEGVQRSGGTLAAKTQVVNHDSIKRTAGGLVE